MSLLKHETNLPLTRLFNTATAKVLDFLLVNEGLRYKESEISELAAVPARTLQRSIQLLSEEKIIRSEKKGRAYYYTVNLASPRVAALLEYMNSTMLDNFDSALKRKSA